jgi:hypothetical protein
MAGPSRERFVRGGAAVIAAGCLPRRAVASNSYAQTVLAKGPVAYWRLSGHGHAGTYHGAPAFVTPGAISGDSDGAVRLNGQPEFVEIASSAAFSQPTSGRGLTVEAWMRPDALTFAGQTGQKYVHWLGKGETQAFEWGFRFYSGDSPSRPNRISAYIWNASGGEGAGAYFQDTLTAGTWIHVVACYDPGDASNPAAGVSIYRDGTLRGSPRSTRGARYASYQIAATPGAAPVRLGTRDLGSFLTGALDEVAIYPRVLTATEVAENHSAAEG